MRKPATPREDAVRSVAGVFRKHGFEGASVTRLAAATGLGRSSLYHYFPDGKPEMAVEAARLAGGDFMRLVVEPLVATGEPRARLRNAVKGLIEFYQRGEEGCLIEHFSVPDGEAAAPLAARQMAEAAMKGFAALALSAGFSRSDANSRAERALINVQGSLVVARALGDGKPFLNALKGLSAVLLPE
jgi:AcrR family transcriptional regulator